MTQHCIDEQYWYGRLSPKGARNYENYWAGYAHHCDSNGANPDWLPVSHFDLRELDETGMIRPEIQYCTAFCPELFYDTDVTIPAWKVEAHQRYDERMRKKLEATRLAAARAAYELARARAAA